MWKKSKGKIVVLPLLFAISPLLHNPLYYLSSPHKQTFSSCFDTELLPVLPAPIPSPWLFQPLLWRGNARPKIGPLPLSKHQVLVSAPQCSCFVYSSDQTAYHRPCVLNIGYPGSKDCAYSVLFILSRLTFLKHWFPRLFCCSITSSTPSLWNPSSLLLMTFFLQFIIVSTALVNKLWLTVQLRHLLGGLQLYGKLFSS